MNYSLRYAKSTQKHKQKGYLSIQESDFLLHYLS